MGAVDTPERGGGDKKQGFRKKKPRIGIRIDMTPMVDIAFLLLIFYMVTTVFAAPQAMEINLPEQSAEEDVIKVKECDLLMIHVDNEGKYWWSWCKEGPVQFKPDSLRILLYSLNKEYTRLSTLIVINEEAKYSDFIDILDEIEVIEYNLREDEDFLARYREDNKDVLEEGATFSYRYATAPWKDGGKWEKKIAKIKSGSLLGGDDES